MSKMSNDDQGFVKIKDKLMVNMAKDLSPRAAWLYAIILQQIRRTSRYNDEPTEDTCRMTFSYGDFLKYSLSKSDFYKGIKELTEKRYLTLVGSKLVRGSGSRTFNIKKY